MSRVREVTPKVFEVLKKYPDARSNDRFLIRAIYDIYYHVSSQPFEEVLMRTDLPSFESIRRARQRIQEYYPDFRAVEPVESIRIAEQEDYINYSREELAI